MGLIYNENVYKLFWHALVTFIIKYAKSHKCFSTNPPPQTILYCQLLRLLCQILLRRKCIFLNATYVVVHTLPIITQRLIIEFHTLPINVIKLRSLVCLNRPAEFRHQYLRGWGCLHCTVTQRWAAVQNAGEGNPAAPLWHSWSG